MKRRGFTLIELLVVVAIIAILMSVLLPALKVAKQQAGAAVCLADQKQLMAAWITYSGENDSLMCGPNTTNVGRRSSSTANEPSYDWVGPPERVDGTLIGWGDGAGCTVEDEIRGIRKGTLFPYYEDPTLTHCPSDKRSAKPPTNTNYGGDGGYRSISIVIHAGSTYTDGTWAPPAQIHYKVSEINNAGSKFVFVEENDNRNGNMNSWVMNWSAMPPSFVDPFAVFHGKSSTLGFADGHSERIQWHDPDTMKWSRRVLEGSSGFYFTDPGNVDLEWLAMHYPRK